MYFLSQTGLGISEALALRWSDIEDNKITIERQTRRSKNNELLLTTLKNTSSYRTIGLQDELVRELKKFKLKQNELIIGSQKFHKNVDGIIFRNYNGNYLTPSIVRENDTVIL